MKALKNKQAMPNVWDCQKKDGANPLMEKFFKPAARQKPVIIFAGDVGAWGNLVTVLSARSLAASYCGHDRPGRYLQDNLIRVHVSPASLSMDALVLEDMHSAPLQEYDLNYWMDIARGQ